MNSKTELLRVAHDYFIDLQPASSIAARLGIPVSRVQRLLRESVQRDLVRVSIPEWDESKASMEHRLADKLRLRNVFISEPAPMEDPLDSIAKEAFRAFSDLISNNQVIGLSHGRAVASFVANMPSTDRWTHLTVTRLVGSLGNSSLTISNDDIVRLFANKLGADINLLLAPIILRNSQLRKALLEEPLLKESFRVMNSTDMAIVGIGDMDFSSNAMLKSHLSESDYDALSKSDAVGEICTHYFNIDGKPVRGAVGRHVISVEERTLKNIPTRIGLACGFNKLDAIRGACAGQYINILVTDSDTARSLLGRDLF